MGVQGERSFHIFYQLLRGASAAERTAWRLPAGPSDFRYLSGAGAVHAIDNVDDAAAFAVVRAAMTAVKIPKDLQDRMFAIVSAVLWLGNVQFVATSDDETGVVKDAAFETACALLEVPEATLEFALTHRKVQAGNEAYELPLNMGNALDARDALAKVRYDAAVAWAVCVCGEVDSPRTVPPCINMAVALRFACATQVVLAKACLQKLGMCTLSLWRGHQWSVLGC